MNAYYTAKMASTQAADRKKTPAHAQCAATGQADVRGRQHPLRDGRPHPRPGCGGIGAVHQLARKVGLIDAIDRDVQLLKVHLPYHEIGSRAEHRLQHPGGGDCLEDLELLRNDEAYLDALGTQRIPDPTTAGDFCRRFEIGRAGPDADGGDQRAFA